ncbi:hypothetical protein EYF80_052402 [Liparis tanakae]|uniref:Uncharacterized protein n=1 Tax=Liparis tanakae TaxID=230148 RepID=A0A4Z2F8F1_9TELE|nr:hypothetical protein EYF80_052402 [Liparis tanakae]
MAAHVPLWEEVEKTVIEETPMTHHRLQEPKRTLSARGQADESIPPLDLIEAQQNHHDGQKVSRSQLFCLEAFSAEMEPSGKLCNLV